MKNFGIFLFFIAFILTTMFVDAWMAYGIIKQSGSVNYSSVIGVVTESRVMHQSNRWGANRSNYTRIEYHYDVNGQTFSNDRLRYGYASFRDIVDSHHASAHNLIVAHPKGSAITVYYNPENPADAVLFTGIVGADLMSLLVLMSLNGIAGLAGIAVYNYFRYRIVKPVAAGVEFFSENGVTRIRLPPKEAYWWGLIATICTAGGLTSLFQLLTTNFNISIPLMLGATILSGVVGLGVYCWRRTVIASGINDLIFNESAKTLDLPATYKRPRRVVIPLSDVVGIFIELHAQSNRQTFRTHAPTLTHKSPPRRKIHMETLIDWPDKRRADDFVEWLGQLLGVPTSTIESTDIELMLALGKRPL